MLNGNADPLQLDIYICLVGLCLWTYQSCVCLAESWLWTMILEIIILFLLSLGINMQLNKFHSVHMDWSFCSLPVDLSWVGICFKCWPASIRTTVYVISADWAGRVYCMLSWCSVKLCGWVFKLHQLTETVLSVCCCLFSLPWRGTQWRHWQSDLDSLQRDALCCSKSKSWQKLLVFPLDLFRLASLLTAVAFMCATQSVLKWRVWHFTVVWGFTGLPFIPQQINKYIFKLSKSEITAMTLVIHNSTIEVYTSQLLLCLLAYA